MQSQQQQTLTRVPILGEIPKLDEPAIQVTGEKHEVVQDNHLRPESLSKKMNSGRLTALQEPDKPRRIFTFDKTNKKSDGKTIQDKTKSYLDAVTGSNGDVIIDFSDFDGSTDSTESLSERCKYCRGNHESQSCDGFDPWNDLVPRSEITVDTKIQKESSSKIEKRCRNCGVVGHIAKFCPTNKDKKKGNNKKASRTKFGAAKLAENYKHLYEPRVQEQEPKVRVAAPGVKKTDDKEEEQKLPNMNKLLHEGKWITFMYLDRTATCFGSYTSEKYDSLPEYVFRACYQARGSIASTVSDLLYHQEIKNEEVIQGYLTWLAMNHQFIHKKVRKAINRMFYFNFEDEVETKYQLAYSYANALQLQGQMKTMMKGSKTTCWDLRVNEQKIRTFISLLLLFVILAGMNIALGHNIFGYPIAVCVIASLSESILIHIILGLIKTVRERNSDVPLTLITTFPTISIYIEEVVKSFPLGARVVGVLEYWKYGTWKNYNWHVRSMKYSLCERLRRHFAYNNQRNFRLMQTYNDTADFPGFVHYPECVEVIPTTELKPTTLPKLENGERARIYGTQHFPQDRLDFRQYAGMHAIMWGVSSFRKGAPSEDNLMAVLEKRIIAPGNTVTDNDVLREMHSVKLKLLPIFELDKTEWRKSLKPVQLARNINYRKDRDDGDKNRPIQMFSKANEVLTTGKRVKNDGDKFVLRPIFSITGKYLDAQGCFVGKMTKYLAEIYGPDPQYPIEYRGIHYYVYFTCGATDKTLNLFFNTAIHATEGVFIMVMGDDILCVNHHSKTYLFLESDFSKFDRTQNYTLQSLYWNYLDESGYSDQKKSSQEMTCAPIEVRHKRGPNMLDKKLREQLEMKMSGEPSTCPANSIINMRATIVAMSNDDPESVYTKAGLKAKIKKDYSHEKTFLRGVFLETDAEYAWMRLPSFIAKFGKTMTDPLTIYGRTDPQTTYKKFILSQWKGYGNLCVNWFYTAIHQQILRICDGVEIHDEEDMPEWFVKATGDVYVPDRIFNDFIWRRYSVSVQQMQSFIDMLNTIETLPCLYYHPLLQQLIDIDY